MAVAKSVSTPFIPTFANTAVSAANSADNNAKIHHINFQFCSKQLITKIKGNEQSK